MKKKVTKNPVAVFKSNFYFTCNVIFYLCLIFIFIFLTEDDQTNSSTPHNSHSSSIQQPTVSASTSTGGFSLTSQTQMTIGQPYTGDTSNFGPIYHTHSSISGYTSPYDRYKMSPPSQNSYNSTYQVFYSPAAAHNHMIRQNGCIDYVPR